MCNVYRAHRCYFYTQMLIASLGNRIRVLFPVSLQTFRHFGVFCVALMFYSYDDIQTRLHTVRYGMWISTVNHNYCRYDQRSLPRCANNIDGVLETTKQKETSEHVSLCWLWTEMLRLNHLCCLVIIHLGDACQPKPCYINVITCTEYHNDIAADQFVVSTRDLNVDVTAAIPIRGIYRTHFLNIQALQSDLSWAATVATRNDATSLLSHDGPTTLMSSLPSSSAVLDVTLKSHHGKTL